jgi:hypothetical protein
MSLALAGPSVEVTMRLFAVYGVGCKSKKKKTKKKKSHRKQITFQIRQLSCRVFFFCSVPNDWRDTDEVTLLKQKLE